MASIQKRTTGSGDTRYKVTVRLKGHPTQTATFQRLTDAKKWVQQTETAIREGRYFRTVEARKRTLKDLVERYIEHVAPGKKDSSNRIRHLRWWSSELGSLRLCDVNTARLCEARDKLLSQPTHQGQKRSPSTVVRYLASLSHAFSMAVREWGWLDDNPVKRVTRPPTPRGRVRFLSEEELARLTTACSESRNPYLRTILIVALATGMRRGELLGLRWKDVDLERGRVTLHETKNGERRIVPLAEVARKALREHSQVRRLDSDLVFPGRRRKDGTTQPASIRDAWVNAVKRAGLDDFRFHDLRHTTASYLAMQGSTMREIADVLGHKTMAMVKRYAHLSEAHTAGVVNTMADSYLGSL